MPVRFSRRAEADLLQIGRYTIERWGVEQAGQYLNELDECCRALACNPRMGRACDEIRPGLRRIGCGRHVIFYRVGATDVIISRILHDRMLPNP